MIFFFFEIIKITFKSTFSRIFDFIVHGEGRPLLAAAMLTSHDQLCHVIKQITTIKNDRNNNKFTVLYIVLSVSAFYSE